MGGLKGLPLRVLLATTSTIQLVPTHAMVCPWLIPHATWEI